MSFYSRYEILFVIFFTAALLIGLFSSNPIEDIPIVALTLLGLLYIRRRIKGTPDAHRLQRFMTRLIKPFEISSSVIEIHRNAALVRVLFGLLLAHHYIDIAGFAILDAEPQITLITDGRLIRVVPLYDQYGGRLDYLRNDLLYFKYSLSWQRLEREEKFVNGDVYRPSEVTLAFMKSAARLDACLTDPTQPHHFSVDVFVVEMVDTDLFPVWDTAAHTVHLEIDVLPEELMEAHYRLTQTSGLSACFDLPPGQFFAATRQQNTHEMLLEANFRTGVP